MEPWKKALVFRQQHFLRRADLRAARLKARKKSQRHGDEQRGIGGNLPEQEQEFIRGHDRLIAGEPEDHRAKRRSGDQAIADGFQGKPLVKEHTQHRHAPVVKQRVCDGNEQKHGQNKAAGQANAFPAVQLRGKKHRADERKRRHHRVKAHQRQRKHGCKI